MRARDVFAFYRDRLRPIAYPDPPHPTGDARLPLRNVALVQQFDQLAYPLCLLALPVYFGIARSTTNPGICRRKDDTEARPCLSGR